MRDEMFDDHSVQPSLPPAIRTAAATVAGATVDTAGNRNFFRTAMMVAFAGAITDGTNTMKLQESDDGTTWSDAINPDGGTPVMGVPQANTTARVSYNGNKRYLRASVTTAGATVGGTVGAVIILASGSGRPVT